MMWLGVLASVLGTVLSRGRDAFDFGTELFGSFVAVSGDAHQAKVAQDIFRQEIRYERSLQIREDIRDVNKMMLESVQTHLFVGSIILGVCFAILIEGHPPEETSRVFADVWIVFCCWSATFTLISLWLALCFQAQISHCARERLLRKHRFQMPDDQVVGKMGGGNLIHQIAVFHDRVLQLAHNLLSSNPAQEEEGEATDTRKRVRRSSLKVEVESSEGRSLDVVPVKKGMQAWMHSSGDCLAAPTVLDIPSYLVGETLIRSRWRCHGGAPLNFRVKGEATLYIAAACPPRETKSEGNSGGGLAGVLQLSGQLLEWPAEELPVVTEGYHQAWKGPSGNGEFRRVNGFSVFVDKANMELPIYKIVLASPDDNGDGMVDIQVDWHFKSGGCEGLLIMVRRGQVHCREEDWPIVEFNEEIKQIMPLRDYSGLYMRYGVFCLILSSFFTTLARLWVEDREVLWWFEAVLLLLALSPALIAIVFIPIHQRGSTLTQTIEQKAADEKGQASMLLTRAKPLMKLRPSRLDVKHVKHPEVEQLPIVESTKSPISCGEPPPVVALPVSTPRAETSPERAEAEREGGGQYLLGDVPPSGSKWRGGSPARDRLAVKASVRVQVPREELAAAGPAARALERLGEAAANNLPTAEDLLARLPELPAGGCGSLELAQCREVFRPRRPFTSRSPERHVAAKERSQSETLHGGSSVALEAGELGHDQGLNEMEEANMSEDEHVVQQESQFYSPEAFSHIIQRIPEVIRPIDPDKPLLIEGAAAKSLRRTLQKFRIWTNFLRIIFGVSLLSALASPYVWAEMLEEAVMASTSPKPSASPSPAGALFSSIAVLQLQWAELEVAWPPFFHPTAAALGILDVGGLPREVLWLAADGVLRAFAAADGGAGDLQLGGVLRSPGPALLLPLSARGLGSLAFGTGAARRGVAAVGVGGVAEVDLRSVEPLGRRVGNGSSPARLLDAVALATLGPPRPLPSGVASDASSVLAAAIFPGLDVVAVAVAEPAAASGAAGSGANAGLRSAVHLCGASANASSSEPLHALGRLGPLAGAARALHGCGAGTCAAEAVLWAAVDGGILAVGLDSGAVLAAFAAPQAALGAAAPALLRGARGESGAVVALAANAARLVAVVATEGRRPRVFAAPRPSLPAAGSVPLAEL